MKEKRLSSLKSCLSLLGDADWFPELDAVLKKRERRERQSGREEAEERGRGKGEKERKKEISSSVGGDYWRKGHV